MLYIVQEKKKQYENERFVKKCTMGKDWSKWDKELDHYSIDFRVQRDAFRTVCKMKVCTCKQYVTLFLCYLDSLQFIRLKLN